MHNNVTNSLLIEENGLIAILLLLFIMQIFTKYLLILFTLHYPLFTIHYSLFPYHHLLPVTNIQPSAGRAGEAAALKIV